MRQPGHDDHVVLVHVDTPSRRFTCPLLRLRHTVDGDLDPTPSTARCPGYLRDQLAEIVRKEYTCALCEDG